MWPQGSVMYRWHGNVQQVTQESFQPSLTIIFDGFCHNFSVFKGTLKKMGKAALINWLSTIPKKAALAARGAPIRDRWRRCLGSSHTSWVMMWILKPSPKVWLIFIQEGSTTLHSKGLGDWTFTWHVLETFTAPQWPKQEYTLTSTMSHCCTGTGVSVQH